MLTKIDKSDASVNQNVVMLTVLGMPRNDISATKNLRYCHHLGVATISQPCGSRYTDNLEIFESKPYFSRLIKENSDTMLVISKMNMNAIRINASVQLLTKQSSVSLNFRC